MGRLFGAIWARVNYIGARVNYIEARVKYIGTISTCAPRVFRHRASFLVQAAWGVPAKAASKE